jgi:hypothetical protein
LIGVDNHLISNPPDCESNGKLIEALFSDVHSVESNKHLDE